LLSTWMFFKEKILFVIEPILLLFLTVKKWFLGEGKEERDLKEETWGK
jgi:hypothetical protein